LAPAPLSSLQRAVFRCLFGRAPYKESQEVVARVLPNEALTLLQLEKQTSFENYFFSLASIL
jgi:hypothetical protein